MGLAERTTAFRYINKIAYFGNTYSPGKVVISVPKSTYGNTNYYFDDSRVIYPGSPTPGSNAVLGVLSANPLASILYTDVSTNDVGLQDHITSGSNVAGYVCWGWHSSLGYYYATNREVNWGTNSGWWIIRTVESFNGDRSIGSGFLSWFDANAFGGSNSYTNTPVGAVCYVKEPTEYGTLDAAYFGLWESGFNFAICAWNSRNALTEGYIYTQVIGDPFVVK